MVNIVLTPGQAVTLFGWLRPRESLRWQDVVEAERLTFAFLRKCGLTPKQLHALQPDMSQWARYGGVKLQDAADMVPLWSTNPVQDLRLDIADIIQAQLPSEKLRLLGITFDSMCDMGLSPDLMRLFGYTLQGWINLGLRRTHIEAMTDWQCIMVFNMQRTMALQCLPVQPPDNTQT